MLLHLFLTLFSPPGAAALPRILFNGNEPDDVRVGSSAVARVYMGNVIVWERGTARGFSNGFSNGFG